jgi:hypothetical protein
MVEYHEICSNNRWCIFKIQPKKTEETQEAGQQTTVEESKKISIKALEKKPLHHEAIKISNLKPNENIVPPNIKPSFKFRVAAKNTR